MSLIATRIRQVALLLFATVLSGMAFLQMFFRIDGYISANYIAMMLLVAALFFVFWGVLLAKQPYASQAILPCIMLLTSIGTVLIARIDRQNNTNIAMKQMIWEIFTGLSKFTLFSTQMRTPIMPIMP